MKALKDFVNETQKWEFDPKDNKCKQGYNLLMKWYDDILDKGLMMKDEIMGCLRYALEQWEKDNYDDLK